ncbi:RusA family crossover junction endodeoxyribonuclease [Ectobacillus panaciterrae]|uniref:RusA family crossover junction endodeoxyribonuclease n=1 Tax=Ectobacillus panaciterrae TaxID=363872 RepID=UPI0009D67CAF
MKENRFANIGTCVSNKKKLQAEQGILRPISKPDADNYIKVIKDACNKVLWNIPLPDSFIKNPFCMKRINSSIKGNIYE